MTGGRIAVGFIVLTAALGGAFLWYTAERAFYEPVAFTPGEAVKAIVVLRDGQEGSEEEILAFCRTRLAGYKLPKSVEFVDAMPMTGTGKISKKCCA